MKKIAIGVCALVLVLAGCSAQATSSHPPTSAAQKGSTGSIPPPQKDANGDYILNVVGQKAVNAQGVTAQLLAYKNVNQTVDMGPIKMTIHDIKIIQLSTMPADFKSSLQTFAPGPIGDKLNYIQIVYDAENTTDQDITFSGIDTITFNTKEQIDTFMKDFMIDGNTNEYVGKVKKTDHAAFIIQSDPSQITDVKFIISSVLDSKSADSLKDQQQVEYKLK